MLIYITKGLPTYIVKKISLIGLMILARYEERRETYMKLEALNMLNTVSMQQLSTRYGSKSAKKFEPVKKLTEAYQETLGIKKKSSKKINFIQAIDEVSREIEAEMASNSQDILKNE